MGIDQLFWPSYSPNLIERLWRFAKKKALRGKHDKDFGAFQKAIDDCLDQTGTKYQAGMVSLMTLRFQTSDTDSFLAA
ncbi:MAG: hypothetical protein JWO38_6901 [Gemmataceae bacterium]|nr:hypothetical protein [Gemmataceae bacterium]